ncbi:hypothetical protein MMC12_006133 [Toensbergia leucococca]|nr:hypothetical protein [Toensbergia leucococca]
MHLTILTDSDVRSLLLSLNHDDISTLQNNLSEALHEYSTGTQETSGCASTNQPQRISVSGQNDKVTLFMPAATSTSTGIKIVSLTAPPSSSSSAASTSSKSLNHSPSVSSTHSTISSVSSQQSTAPSTLSSQSTKPSIYGGQFTEPSITSSQSTNPTGSLTLLSPTGIPTGFLAASELTAFRTALASSILLSKRTHLHDMTVFGAGKQAEWHIRLALILRASEIHHINIINRSFSRAQHLMQEIYTSPEWAALRAANPKLKISVLSSDYGEYTRMVKEHVRKADIIFLCTPSLSPLFPAEYLTSTEGRKKGRYISAIGSYRPHMIEIHPDIIRQAVAPDHKHHHHRHAEKGGVIIVDSLEACLKEAGECIQAGLGAEQLVEVGELVMVRKAAMKEIEMGGKGELGLKRWLEAGNVVFKSVGLGLMDVCVGEDLVLLAGERGFGTIVEGF